MDKILKPNTIRDRGLPAILRGHIATAHALSFLRDVQDSGFKVVMYMGAHHSALDTIAWFLQGKKLES